MKTKNLTIFDHAHVTRIVADANGRVTGVTLHPRRQGVFPARQGGAAGVATPTRTRGCCCFRNRRRIPNGLVEQSRPGGQALLRPLDASNVSALFPFDLNIWYGLPAQGATVDDWADDNFDHAGLGFIGGASLHVNTERHPIDAAAMNTFGRAPALGLGVESSSCTRTPGAWTSTYLQTNTLPLREHVSRSGPGGERSAGRSGVPHHHRRPARRTSSARCQYAQNKMEEWFRAAGAIEVIKPPPIGPGI